VMQNYSTFNHREHVSAWETFSLKDGCPEALTLPVVNMADQWR
jgi:hypothetical protein